MFEARSAVLHDSGIVHPQGVRVLSRSAARAAVLGLHWRAHALCVGCKCTEGTQVCQRVNPAATYCLAVLAAVMYVAGVHMPPVVTQVFASLEDYATRMAGGG